MRKILILFSGVLLLSACSEQEEISYPDLAHRLIDLEALALLPEPGESSAMFSSYDRRSIFNSETGSYENWEANADGAGYLRQEGEEYVLAEMEGPGAIVRIWSALPGEGRVKIYIDGSTEPVIDLPFIKYFDGSTPPFNYPQLVYHSANGQNNYVPISYNESCRVVAEEEWGRYYHFNYYSFPEGTRVQPFTMEPGNADLYALESINDYLEDCRGRSPYPPGIAGNIIKEQVIIEPGGSYILADIPQSGAISSIRITTDLPGRDIEEPALRKSILSMYWDGESDPSVWSPLGDFFGSSPGYNPYRSLPLGMTREGMYCFWYMPYETGAKILLDYEGDSSYALEYEILYGDLQHEVQRYSRFHAKWHTNLDPVPEDRWPDWTLLEAEGSGRFAGTMLGVRTDGRDPCVEAAKPGDAWWGEGDEKFFVDGEQFPSTFGTGTEDYFGYAWGTAEYFERAYNTQSLSMNNTGYQTVSRFHIADNIPFFTSFDAYLEKYYPDECGTEYVAVVYWYLDTGGVDPLGPQPVSLTLWAPPPQISPSRARFLKGDKVTVRISSESGTVRYTTDGTEPGPDSPLYEKPFRISQTCVVKAKVMTEMGRESSVAEGIYQETALRKSLYPGKDFRQGIRYSFYEGQMSEVAGLSELTAQQKGVLENVSISSSSKEDYFGFVFEGFIRVPEKGMYTFYLVSDDGSKMWIGDEPVVSNDFSHAPREASGQIALHSGYHPLRVDYFEHAGGQELQFLLAGPGIRKMPVPDEYLYYLED